MHCVNRSGAGLPVVFLHGFCQSSEYWTPTLDQLANTGRAGFAADLPGFAGSAQLGGPYTMETYADALAGVLDKQRIPCIVLVGGSMGGVVAQQFALRHPDRLARLLLVATGAYTADPETALSKADALATADWNEATVAPVVAGFFHQPPPAEEMGRFRCIALSASQAAAVDAARSNARTRTFERLGEIAVPTMIMQGRHDRARTPEHAIAMQELIPQCQVVVLERSGHTPQLEDPVAFHATAVPFLTADA
ncbi:MAG TPA: alpha/beta hydrolase [Acetobacteraceae bacterium]|jgi:pimeloyl-ACP methyl ester carboxylesterase|nr:alpha/beta hydrolase [Acetobacteraceae bacterium]